MTENERSSMLGIFVRRSPSELGLQVGTVHLIDQKKDIKGYCAALALLLG